jgi:hypothetical protein
VLAEKQLTNPERVELAYRLTVSRRPTAGELRRVADYINAFGDASKNENFKDSKDPNKLRADAWATFCQALFASAEFRYLN